MDKPIVYYCEECGKTVSKEDGETVNFCCEKSMKSQVADTCLKSGSSAEHARFNDEDEPCDEGR